MIIIFEDILVPFLTIALAELGDKTQVSVLLLSSRTKKYSSIFFGVFLAFLIVDGIAIALGSLITTVFDISILQPISGLVFIIFGVYMLLRRKEEKEEKPYKKHIFFAAFLIIFLSEWGDKTQVAAALFATRYNAVFVLLGTLLALSLLSLMAIFFGKLLSTRLNRRLLTLVAAVVFIILGVSCFLL